MGIRKYKPTTPGCHDASVSDFVEITRSEPEESLLHPFHKTGDRNSNGRVTAYHRGGGYKCQYRIIDFRRHSKDGVPVVIAHIEYDPSRATHIALLHYTDGEKRYILAPAKLSQGDRIEADVGTNIKSGNSLPLRNIPLDVIVHAVELKPGGGAKTARSADSSVQLATKKGYSAQLCILSGEIRNVEITCRATAGEVDNTKQSNISWGKAGHIRWRGEHPHIRGVVMNPVDHPRGGGEGRASDGRRPVSPWGKPEDRTRHPNKGSDRLIVHRRKTGKNH